MKQILCRIGYHRNIQQWYDQWGRHVTCLTCGFEKDWHSEFPRLSRLIWWAEDLWPGFKRAWTGRWE